MGRRIGSIFSQTAYADSVIVVGSNGPQVRGWEDVLYDYFLLRVDVQNKEEVFNEKNRQYEAGLGSSHVHIYRRRSQGKHGQAKTFTDYQETYAIEIYTMELETGGLMSPMADFLVNEMKRIFMRYPSYNIAGIREINNFEAGEPIPPESETNPFQGVYKVVVTIDIFYMEQFLYPQVQDWEINHYGSRYSAGSFVDEIEDPLQIP